MTEQRGRAARWQTAMLLVPGAAVTFGAAVAWAAGTTPTTAPAPTTPLPAFRHSDHVAHAQAAAYRHRLEHQIQEHRRHAQHLQHQLRLLRTRTRNVPQPAAPVPGPIAPIGAPAANAPVVIAPAPAPPVVAPPPPVNAVTGASGHP